MQDLYLFDLQGLVLCPKHSLNPPFVVEDEKRRALYDKKMNYCWCTYRVLPSLEGCPKPNMAKQTFRLR